MSDIVDRLRLRAKTKTNPPPFCSHLEDEAADRITALEAELAGVHGGTHCIVPVEPTDRVRDAIINASYYLSDRGGVDDLWDAVIKASQEQDK